MAVHDWTKVFAGIFHHFHCLWIGELSRTLNDGLLPEDYYALAEQSSGQIVPDVVTLRKPSQPESGGKRREPSHTGLTALVDAPPKVRLMSERSEAALYAARRRQVVIRHRSDDDVVAIIEIVSPGNKLSRIALEQFIDKAYAALQINCHLMIIDLFSPGSHDPAGIHGLLWEAEVVPAYSSPFDKPLTLMSYMAGPTQRAFVEPVGVGDTLPDMPLFLEPEWYVNVPLERTYMLAYAAVPQRWRDVLER